MPQPTPMKISISGPPEAVMQIVGHTILSGGHPFLFGGMSYCPGYAQITDESLPELAREAHGDKGDEKAEEVKNKIDQIKEKVGEPVQDVIAKLENRVRVRQIVEEILDYSIQDNEESE